MGTLYVSQVASGYNNAPPSDDGSQTASNQITWNSTIKAKLADPIKVLADAINTQLTTVLDLSPRAIAANDSAVASDHWRTLQVTGTTTITLSDAATMTNKYVVGIANLGVGTVTVTRATGANTINGAAADITLQPKAAVVLGVNQGATGYNVLSSTGIALTSLTTPIVDSGSTGSLSLKTNNGTTQAVIDHAATAVNAIHLLGAATGAISYIGAQGETNSAIGLYANGSGTVSILTNGVAGNVQCQFIHTVSANRNITITGSNGGNPTISTTAGSLAITPAIVAASTIQGASTIGVGATTPSASGAGISFPATQSASTDVNTLDDYEEGTWVPSLGGSTTYTTQTGTYTKIGRMVYVNCFLVINAIGTGSATQISGLPFTSTAVAHELAVQVTSGSVTSIVSASASIGSSSTTITIASRTAASISDSVNAIFGNGTTALLSGCYHTT